MLTEVFLEFLTESVAGSLQGLFPMAGLRHRIVSYPDWAGYFRHPPKTAFDHPQSRLAMGGSPEWLDIFQVKERSAAIDGWLAAAEAASAAETDCTGRSVATRCLSVPDGERRLYKLRAAKAELRPRRRRAGVWWSSALRTAARKLTSDARRRFRRSSRDHHRGTHPAARMLGDAKSESPARRPPSKFDSPRISGQTGERREQSESVVFHLVRG
jgi:hypothetical protein